MVQPVPLAAITYSTVIVRYTVTDGVPTVASLHRGAYVRMDTPNRESFEADSADAICTRAGDDLPSCVSAPWTRGIDGAAAGVLTTLLQVRRVESVPLEWPETEHLKTWLIARNPEGLTMAGLNREVGFGVADRDHLAFVAVLPESHLYADAPDSPALARLRPLIAEWCEAGPRIDDLCPRLTPDRGGWAVSATP